MGAVEREGREIATDGHHWTESRDLQLDLELELTGHGLDRTGRDWAGRDRKGQTGQDRTGQAREERTGEEIAT